MEAVMRYAEMERDQAAEEAATREDSTIDAAEVENEDAETKDVLGEQEDEDVIF